MTLKQIAKKLGGVVDQADVARAILGGQECRIETDGESHRTGNAARYWLSSYERAGLHPNAGEVMGWLENGPATRQYIVEGRPEMRAALAQLLRVDSSRRPRAA